MLAINEFSHSTLKSFALDNMDLLGDFLPKRTINKGDDKIKSEVYFETDKKFIIN
jgi:hypothetical protein